MHRFGLSAGLLVLSLVVLTSASGINFSQLATRNVYRFFTEDNIDERYNTSVVPFWDTVGKPGYFPGVDGISIAYMTFIHPSEKGAVVLCSGRGESYLKYKETVYDIYNRLGYSVYIHDHRGQGRSGRLLPDRSKGHVERFDDYATDLETFVTRIVNSRNHKVLFLMAHSMGGAVATRHIQLYPGRFDAVAMSAPMHAPNTKFLVSGDKTCKFFMGVENVCRSCFVFGIPNRYKAAPFNPKKSMSQSPRRYAIFRSEYAADSNVQLGGPTHGWISEACENTITTLRSAGSIRTPVLVLQASDDVAVLNSAQDAFCNALKASTGQGCVNPDRSGKPIRIEGARHEFYVEADQYRIPALTLIFNFFKEIASKRRNQRF